ncbi:MAG: hypothetical protein GWN07_29550, partial [Actinobacteria bacterium]|nr:hypothetical protein [Actinomycetota bacterium]NIX23745.1 hypothetical protein [Actinomycetota bacterium]
MSASRLALLAVLVGVLPGSATAQLSLLGGVGISSPLGDFSNEATTGYHARLGVQVSLPALPVALRADGDYHAFSAARSGVEDPDVL